MSRVGNATRSHWRSVRLIAAALLLAIGGMHAVSAPDQAQAATYVGILFGLNALTSLVLAIAMLWRPRAAWPLAVTFAAVTLLLYVLARTVGLPAYKETDWIDAPFGIASVVLESSLIALVVTTRFRPGAARPPASLQPRRSRSISALG